MASTIDTTTKINIGIRTTSLVAAVFGGAVYLTQMRTGIDSMRDAIVELKTALNRNTAQLAIDSKDQAILRELVRAVDARVTALERVR